MKTSASPLQDIKAVIWDYDGVHYDYAAFPAWSHFDHIRIAAVQRYLPELGAADIIRIAEDGYHLRGDTVQGFYDWAMQNGHEHDAKAIRQGIFRDYHRDLFNHVAKEYPGHITAHQPAIEAFRKCAGVVQHALLTNSSPEHWAVPHLKAQKLLEFFNPAALFGLDDIDYRAKIETIAGLERALKVLDLKPHQALFAEDSLANLAFAHANLDGLNTVFIHHGRPLETLPPYVTRQERNPMTIMQGLARAYGL